MIWIGKQYDDTNNDITGDALTRIGCSASGLHFWRCFWIVKSQFSGWNSKVDLAFIGCTCQWPWWRHFFPNSDFLQRKTQDLRGLVRFVGTQSTRGLNPPRIWVIPTCHLTPH
jgi:hypothetical protein